MKQEEEIQIAEFKYCTLKTEQSASKSKMVKTKIFLGN